MIVTNAEQIHLLQVYTNEKDRDIREASAFIDGMNAAFKLVDTKLKMATATTTSIQKPYGETIECRQSEIGSPATPYIPTAESTNELLNSKEIQP